MKAELTLQPARNQIDLAVGDRIVAGLYITNVPLVGDVIEYRNQLTFSTWRVISRTLCLDRDSDGITELWQLQVEEIEED